MRIRTLSVAMLALFMSSHVAVGADRPDASGANLVNTFPGVQVGRDGERVVSFYGAPMTSAATPDAAAQLWWEDHAGAFGLPDIDVRLVRSYEVGRIGKSTVFAFQQFLDGLPVEYGIGRLLVLNGSPNYVVYVAGHFAQVPDGGFRSDIVSAARALRLVKAEANYAHLPVWSDPELVIFNGEAGQGPGPAIRAWKFQGREPGEASTVKFTFFVDASSGLLAHVRDDVYHIDVFGHVAGLGSPGVLPDADYNPPVEMDMPEIEVRIQGGAAAIADRDGHYVVSNEGAEPVTVETGPVGPWSTVRNEAGENIFLEQPVLPPGPADFLFNDISEEFVTAQVNGFIHTTNSHDFFKDRQPDFEGLDIPLLTRVNDPRSCDAFFNGSSIIFLRAGSVGEFECPNSCYSTIIAHEYGHFVLSRHGVGGGAFAEGYSDTYALMMFNDTAIGAGLVGEGTIIRDYTCGNVQYPCSPPPPCGAEPIQNNPSHACGKLLGGVWWDIKLNIESTMGEEPGLELSRQLFTDWTGITLGGQGLNSAHPATAVEILTVDDDDGDLGNGTPHYDEICDAFSAHGIPCPEIDFTLLLPEELTVIRGRHVAGELADLFAGDDSRMTFQPGLTQNPDEPPIWLELTGTSVTDAPAELRFTLETRADTPNVTQTISLFNYVTEMYEEVDASPTPFNKDGTVEVTVGGDPSRFINSKTLEVKAELTWAPPPLVLMFPWTVGIDQAVWKIIP